MERWNKKLLELWETAFQTLDAKQFARIRARVGRVNTQSPKNACLNLYLLTQHETGVVHAVLEPVSGRCRWVHAFGWKQLWVKQPEPFIRGLLGVWGCTTERAYRTFYLKKIEPVHPDDKELRGKIVRTFSNFQLYEWDCRDGNNSAFNGAGNAHWKADTCNPNVLRGSKKQRVDPPTVS